MPSCQMRRITHIKKIKISVRQIIEAKSATDQIRQNIHETLVGISNSRISTSSANAISRSNFKVG